MNWKSQVKKRKWPVLKYSVEWGLWDTRKNFGRCNRRSHHSVIVSGSRQDNKTTVILKREFYPVLKYIPQHDVWERAGRSCSSLILIFLVFGGQSSPSLPGLFTLGTDFVGGGVGHRVCLDVVAGKFQSLPRIEPGVSSL